MSVGNRPLAYGEVTWCGARDIFEAMGLRREGLSLPSRPWLPFVRHIRSARQWPHAMDDQHSRAMVAELRVYVFRPETLFPRW
eukprot:7377446-Prymnesium_polylepis.1